MTNRPLTQEELNIVWSLDWNPTHYNCQSDCVACVFNDDNAAIICDGELAFEFANTESLGCDDSPIPQKPFDIESVEWSDVSRILGIKILDERECIEVSYSLHGRKFETKHDIINKAKALGVTPEDLK